MAATAAKKRQLVAAVLVSVLAAAAALAQEKPTDKPKQIEVDAYALVQVPGCNVGKPNSLVLPPGRWKALFAPFAAGMCTHSNCCAMNGESQHTIKSV